MEFHVLNFLSTMERIFYGVLPVKLSFYNGNNLLWSVKLSFYVLNFLSTMETIFNGVSRVKLSFYNGKNLLWSFPC